MAYKIVVNGVEMDPDSDEYRDWERRRNELTGGIDSILSGRRAPGGHLPACWPMVSDVCGIGPDQIPEAVEHDRQNGLNIEYTPDGRAVYPDAATRRRHAESLGMYDRNGGYSDPQKKRGKSE